MKQNNFLIINMMIMNYIISLYHKNIWRGLRPLPDKKDNKVKIRKKFMSMEY